jgi:tetratricopeptide (TPR) repeat protein
MPPILQALTLTLCAMLFAPASWAAPIAPYVQALAADWDDVKYKWQKDKRGPGFEAVAAKAAQAAAAHPGEAAPLVWQGIALASQAGEDGGLSALGLVKRAKEVLEQAERLEPEALGGSIYTTLGSLYYQVPGWPLGFGDNDKARQYLQKALAANPTGLDANFFWGDYLMEQGDYAAAMTAFEKAMQAPLRADRPLADAGRREEAQARLTKVRQLLQK